MRFIQTGMTSQAKEIYKNNKKIKMPKETPNNVNNEEQSTNKRADLGEYGK